jgi:hypothetical protein
MDQCTIDRCTMVASRDVRCRAMKGTRWLVVVMVALAAWLASARLRHYPGPAVQGALDAFAPDLPLGGRVGAAARARYALRVAPYLGYRTTTYVGPGGLRGLGVEVDAYVDDGDPHVSRWARVVAVHLTSPDSARTARLEAMLRARLGAPTERCVASPYLPRRRVLRWSGWNGRGVELRITREPSAPMSAAARRRLAARGTPATPPTPAGVGIVVFGALPPSFDHDTLEPCGR